MVKLSENSRTVLEKRYLRKELGKVVESPDEMFHRVASNVAEADKVYVGEGLDEVSEKAFYELLSSLDFLPNSPTLMNAGRPLQMLSACFVIPVGDSMEEIFDAVKAMAIIQKSGGGTGFSFSKLRPSDDAVGSTSGVASGPISFMRVFNETTETVKQGGTRRGASMAVLSVHHPDILQFITCKESGVHLNNFNISVAVTDDFMEAVKTSSEFDLINPRTKVLVKKLSAREVFDQIVYYAWKNGDPGIIFIDKINKANPTPEAGEFEATNPCGEQPLLPYESCNLGSINLSNMVFTTSTGNKSIDWDKLRHTVCTAVHFLDNVIDVNRYTLPQIETMTKSNRKIGLGVMGFADALIQLGLPYGEPRSLKLADEIMLAINTEARDESARLGKLRGSFPNFNKSTLKGKYKAMRNATVTTIAPTGSISLIAGVSSGIEPIFAVAFKSVRLDGTELLEINPNFEAIAKEKGFYSEELMQKIVEAGSLKDVKEVPPAIKKLFSTAHEIDPEDHIKMQVAFQKYTDNAVSKTINLNKESTVDDVAKAYIMAYELGAKGITIYRDMSRTEQVLYKGTPSKEAPTPKKRGDITKGYTKKISTGCGSLYVTLNEDVETGKLFEVFARIGKAGGCASAQSESTGRLASMALRAGMEIGEIIEQLSQISCHKPTWTPKGKVTSCADAIAKALEWYLETKGEEALPKKRELHSGACPNCGGSLMYSEGCAKCHCGYSDCG